MSAFCGTLHSTGNVRVYAFPKLRGHTPGGTGPGFIQVRAGAVVRA